MNKWMNKQMAGWVAAALLGGAFVGYGFQGGTEKTGVVDLNRIMQQSEAGKANTKILNDAVAARRGLMDFVNTYSVLTTEQAQSLRELTLKPNPTEADKTAIEKIKADVTASDKKRSELSQKQTMTDADRSLLQDYANRARTMEMVIQRWQAEFGDELRETESQLRDQTLTKAKSALQEVAKAQGYSIVYESTIAPYGANDLTDASIKAMNAKK